MWFNQEIKLSSNNWCRSHVSTGQHCQPAELRLGYTLNRCAGEVAASTRRTLPRTPGTSFVRDMGDKTHSYSLSHTCWIYDDRCDILRWLYLHTMSARCLPMYSASFRNFQSPHLADLASWRLTQWLLYVPLGIPLKIVRFLRISEQTAIFPYAALTVFI
jgi:hypothetical protein